MSSADELQRLIDQAREQNAKIVVIEAPAAAGISADETALSAGRIEDRAIKARARFREIAREAAKFPELAGVAIRGYDANLSSAWLIWTVVSTIIFLAIGHGVAMLVSRWARAHFRYMFDPEPSDRIEKIAYLLTRAVMESVGVAVMVVVALLLTIAFDEGHEHVRATQAVIVISVASVMFWSVFFGALFASDAPNHRMLNLSDADAAGLHSTLIGILSAIALLLGVSIWMEALNLDANAHLLSVIGATFLSALALSGFAIGYRRAIAGVILGDTPAEHQPLPAIRDVFSGAFFLIDDAFRLGEYIDIGEVKGTVEKNSIRSMQLRHHKGPLNTIPFGEIRHLTNFSRDWVVMKLPLRVTYDTDVEKVRKLIKNLGQELLEHPEIGDQFLEPLKSQGVYQMEDSAIIIRVKFMTKPGDQFVIRKLVYARIRDLFIQEGIKFAHKEVTVRVAESSGVEPLSKEVKEAVAGAARQVIDADQTAAPVSAGER